MICIEEGCDRPVLIKMRGLCSTHYAYWRRKNVPGVLKKHQAAQKKWNERRRTDPTLKARVREYKRYEPSARYCNTRSSARKKELEFVLTKEEYISITQQSCFYCGGWNDEKYKFTGVDRIDNSIGYLLSNCIAACSKCNFMKRNMEIHDFLEHIRQIVKNFAPVV